MLRLNRRLKMAKKSVVLTKYSLFHFQRVPGLSNLVEAQLLINPQVPPQPFNLEKLKLTPLTLDHQHLRLLNLEDFHSVEAPPPEVTFSNLAEVRQIPTPPPHQLLVQQLPHQANQRQKVHSLLGVHPNPNPLLGVLRNPNPRLVGGLNPQLKRQLSVSEVGLQLLQPQTPSRPNNLRHLIYLLLEEVPVVLPRQILSSLLPKLVFSNLVPHLAPILLPHQVLVQHLPQVIAKLLF
jgi:hypothetical protein